MSYLRDYQIEIRDAVLTELNSGVTSTLYVQPTGTGKTEVALDIIDQWPDKSCQILCIAHRQELIYQPFNRWQQKTGEYPNMEMAEYRKGKSRLTFASKDSLHPDRLRKAFPDPKAVGLIWIDEAHHLAATSKSYNHILEYFTEANFDCRYFGCTATPDRTDELALGQMFNSVAADYPLIAHDEPNAIGDGWLVPIEQEIVIVEELAFEGVGNRGGDFIDGQLQKMLMENKGVERIVAATRQIADGRTTLLFAAGIEQAVLEAEILNAEQPDSAYVIASRIPDGKDFEWVVPSGDRDRRQRMLKRWSRGEFPYLANVGVFTEGMDEPTIACISMGRPTKSRSLYTQMLGRGTRILPNTIEGKNDDGTYWRLATREERLAAIEASDKRAITVLDFVGNSRHSLISSVDILGGKYSDDILDAAKRKVSAGEPDVVKALADAELEDIERRKTVRAKATVQRRKIDPFTVIGAVATREPGWHKGRKPTKGQLEALAKFRVEEQFIKDMTFHTASKLLDGLIGRAKKKLCTYRQAKVLQGHGYDTDNMTFTEASKAISELSRNGWKRKPSLTC